MDAEFSTFGTIDCGAEMMTRVWSTMDHVFAIRRAGESTLTEDKEPKVIIGPHRQHLQVMEKLPVDILVVERGHLQRPSIDTTTSWGEMVRSTAPSKRPKVVLEAWPAKAHMWTRGAMGKLAVTQWSNIGYYSRCRLIRSTSHGGAIKNDRFVVVRHRQDTVPDWTWAEAEPSPSILRTMGNLLTPPGLFKGRYMRSYRGPVPKHDSDPMPGKPGSPISTLGGIRRLQPDEVFRGLGGLKDDPVPTVSMLERTSSVFIWECLSTTMAKCERSSCPDISGSKKGMHASSAPTASQTTTNDAFSWRPPDISEGSPWYLERVANLQAAAATCPDPIRIVEEGLQMLSVHRTNYDQDGPKPSQLQVLWWEFPPEHWTALREGSRMNFLELPVEQLHDNANMDKEQLEVAAAFVDELVALGVLRKSDIKTNGPMFVVPKEGQPGQWRVISDMLRGGQNCCIGSDPVFLPRVSHIVQELYEDSWLAVVDASKYFWQFGTHPDDQPYLGCIHPVTGVLYHYAGLPMGSGQSPSLGTRYGLAFLRKLRQRFGIFQGSATANCYWTSFSDGDCPYRPGHGYGLVWEGPNGLAVRIYVFVDDFLISAPTQALCTEALTLFLDEALNCGLLCHPKKITPPSQRVRYCGFEFDVSGIPALHIPIPKREKALAMVSYVVEAQVDHQFSRLGLAVVAGVLQSLVEATPKRLGHTKLRRLHSSVHPPGAGTGAEPYYSYCTVSSEVRRDLEWWLPFLTHEGGAHIRMQFAATLVPTFGDGSGTGTGGTFTLPEQRLKMWKGKWLPCIFHMSSNWKELSTLRLTLRHIKDLDPTSVRGTTLFYFTDNSVTYWIASSGSSKHPPLHKLIEEIRALEFQLGCQLVVVHIPGYLLISQGTDGLSRGVWMSRYHDLIDEATLLSGIFAPLPFDSQLVDEYIHYIPSRGLLPPQMAWTHVDWRLCRDATEIIGRFSVWFPPPETARQVLSTFLEAYCEQPLTTAGLFFVPRVMPAFWGGLSRYIHEVATIYPHVTQLRVPPLVPIPVIVLYVPPHQRSLPAITRLDAFPATKWQQRHLDEADHVRRLPPTSL